MVERTTPEINLELAGMEDGWGDLFSKHKIEREGWERIVDMAEIIYGDSMAVSGVTFETARRYALIASTNKDAPFAWGQSENDGKIIKTQGEIILAGLDEIKRFSPESGEYRAIQQMLKDLFENNLFSICVADDGRFVISSPINTRKWLNQEDWVIVQIGGKNHITPRPEQGMIGRTCFSPTFTNALTDERRSFGLKGESAENVASRMAKRRIGRIIYSVYEPEKLPDCVIDVGVQSGESEDRLVYSLVI